MTTGAIPSTEAAAPNLVSALDRAATVAGDHVAVAVFERGSLDLASWAARSTAAAHGLRAAGVRRGHRVLVLAEPRHILDYFVAYLAIQRAGGVVVTSSPSDGAEEVCRRHRLVQPALVLGLDADHADDGAGGLATVPLADVEDHGRHESGAFEQPGLGDLAELVFTSGSTGTTKAVACTHRDLAHFLDADGLERGGQRRPFLHLTRPGTNAAQRLIALACTGHPMLPVSLPRFDPVAFSRCLEDQEPEVVALFPQAARLLLAHLPDGATFPAVRAVSVGSAPVSERLRARLAEVFPAAEVLIMYGLTEAGSARTMCRWGEGPPGSVGLPAAGTEVEVRDDDRRRCAPNERGHVWVRAAGPTRWYYGDPESTASTFVDGWVRTGDVGTLSDEGHLTIVDREKDIIITSGLKVAPSEIEQAVEDIPGLLSSAAVGIHHGVVGEQVVLAIESEVQSDGLLEAVHARLMAALPSYKRPATVVTLRELARTPLGKLDKPRIRAAVLAKLGEADTPEVRPLATIVGDAAARSLGLAAVDPDIDLFELGLDSLGALEIAAVVGDAVGVALDITLAFEHTTVRAICKAVDAHVAERDDHKTGEAP